MSIDVEPPRPAPLTVRGLVAVGWEHSGRLVRRVNLADLGAVRLYDLPTPTRALVRIGFVLLAAMLGFLVASDLLRGSGSLVAGSGGVAGRGSVVPEAALPATLFAIAVAWTYLLTGALHSSRPLRLGLLAAYVGTTSSWIVGSIGTTAERALSWALIAAVPAWFAVRWRARPRPGLEFLVLLSVVGGAHVVVQRLLLDAWRISGVATFLPTVQTTVLLVGSFVTPLLILVGIDIADFVLRTSAAVSASARRLPPLLLTSVTVVALAVAAWSAGGVVLSGEAGGPLAFLGALGVPLTTLGVVVGVRRLSRDVADVGDGEPPTAGPQDDAEPVEPVDPAEPAAPAEPGEPDPLVARTPGAGVLDVATSNAARLALAFSGWEVLLVAMTLVALGALSIGGLEASGVVTWLISTVSSLTGPGQTAWLLVLGVAAVAACPVLARHGRAVTATYLGIVGALVLYSSATGDDGPLAALEWPSRRTVTAWWTLALLAAVGWAAWRRRLDAARQEVVVLLVGVLLLAGGSEAVGDPFSPFFAFAGLGLVVLGVAWDALTIGSWANEDSRAFPRADRMLLYLGYVLFSLAVIGWAVASHDVARVEFFTEGASDIGLAYFGIPVLYATYVLGLERLVRRTPQSSS